MRHKQQMDAVLRAKDFSRSRPVFLDTETTGLDARAEIVEICIIDYDGAVLVNTMVKPTAHIPREVVRVHGITDQMVQGARSWLHVWPEIVTALAGRVVGIYNAEFDLRMMKQTHKKYGMPWRNPASKMFCIMKLYSEFYGSFRWQSLDKAGRQSGISLNNSHRALDDTKLAREVFMHMVAFPV